MKKKYLERLEAVHHSFKYSKEVNTFHILDQIDIPESHHKCPIRDVVPSLLEKGRVGHLWDVQYDLDNPKAIRCPYGCLGDQLEINNCLVEITSIEAKKVDGWGWDWHVYFKEINSEDFVRKQERIKLAELLNNKAEEARSVNNITGAEALLEVKQSLLATL